MPLVRTLENIAFYGLLAVIFLSAIPYGSVGPIARSLVIVSICVIAVIRIVHGALTRSNRISAPTIFLPLAGILLLAIVQMLPLTGQKPISRDPHETKIFIVTFAALVIAGEVLIYFTNSRRRLQTLILLVVITGVAGALFGIVRHVALNDALAAYFPADWQSFGFFVNRNHFALLMEMSLGLIAGLLLKGQAGQRLKFLGWFLAALFIYAIIAANSRGGLVSLAAIAVFAMFVHIMTKQNDAAARNTAHEGKGVRTLASRTVAAAAAGCLIFVIFVFTVAFVGGDAAVTRIEKIPGEIQATATPGLNRHSIWRSTVEMIKKDPIFGVGFGGYAVAFPAFDHSNGEGTIEQAHNEYLEIVANGGIIAFVLFTAFAALVVRRARENFSVSDPLVRSSCFGALIGMFGVLVHSVVDFGLHVFVNALIFVSLIVIATVRIPRSRSAL